MPQNSTHRPLFSILIDEEEEEEWEIEVPEFKPNDSEAFELLNIIDKYFIIDNFIILDMLCYVWKLRI